MAEPAPSSWTLLDDTDSGDGLAVALHQAAPGELWVQLVVEPASSWSFIEQLSAPRLIELLLRDLSLELVCRSAEQRALLHQSQRLAAPGAE